MILPMIIQWYYQVCVRRPIYLGCDIWCDTEQLIYSKMMNSIILLVHTIWLVARMEEQILKKITFLSSHLQGVPILSKANKRTIVQNPYRSYSSNCSNLNRNIRVASCYFDLFVHILFLFPILEQIGSVCKFINIKYQTIVSSWCSSNAKHRAID